MPNLKEMWQAGASYEELHRVDAPYCKCECDYCGMMRCLVPFFLAGLILGSRHIAPSYVNSPLIGDLKQPTQKGNMKMVAVKSYGLDGTDPPSRRRLDPDGARIC
jgi:hypothetical protein